MRYSVKFPNHSIEKKFEKVLKNVPHPRLREEIIRKIEELSLNPRPFGEKPFKILKPPIQFYKFCAQYRIRIGDYRVLYDVEEEKKIVWILALRKRSENTYK